MADPAETNHQFSRRPEMPREKHLLVLFPYRESKQVRTAGGC